MKINEQLSVIQIALKAPKGQQNTFGNYSYRSCSDIIEAVKPHLHGAVLTLSDDVVAVGDRVYVKATATITLDNESIATTAFAREAVSRKGMDDSQITGTASSYARKYALNGLFAIDDTKDADTNEYFKQMSDSLLKSRNALTKSVHDNDASTCREVWDELSADEHEVVWSHLDSKMRSSIKLLLKAEAA